MVAVAPGDPVDTAQCVVDLLEIGFCMFTDEHDLDHECKKCKSRASGGLPNSAIVV